MIMYTLHTTQCHTQSGNQFVISQAVLLIGGVAFFFTALEVVPGHPIAFPPQSLLWLSGHPDPCRLVFGVSCGMFWDAL